MHLIAYIPINNDEEMASHSIGKFLSMEIKQYLINNRMKLFFTVQLSFTTTILNYDMSNINRDRSGRSSIISTSSTRNLHNNVCDKTVVKCST